MTRKLVIAATAKKDLHQIWDYIAQDSFDAADRVRDAIETAMIKLCDMPTMGHQRRDVKDDSLRFWNVYSYLIAYRYTRNRVSVARVVSGYRNFRQLFRSG